MTTPKCFKNSYVKVGLMVVIIAVFLAAITIFLYFNNQNESSTPNAMSQKLKLPEFIKTKSLKTLVASFIKGKFLVFYILYKISK